jgi:thiol-disulfide isomerase/thioredoxin
MIKRIYRARFLLVAALVCVVVIVGVVFVVSKSGVSQGTITEDSRTYLTDYAGNKVKLSDFKRRVVIAHSWASWCTYCKDELQNLGKIQTIYGDDITIVAINRAESLVDAKAFTDTLNLPPGIVLLLDPTDTFYKEIEGFAMPETIGLNVKGEQLFHQHGPLRFEEISKYILNLDSEPK